MKQLCIIWDLDAATVQPKACRKPAEAVCVACTRGTCDVPRHACDWFCTPLPPGDADSPGTKLFYWCETCKGPVCSRCLGIEEEYPCLPEQVLFYRFPCPNCGGAVRVVAVPDVDMEGAVKELLRRVKAGR
jgi:hypothetical protein